MISPRRQRRGASAIEFGLVLPLLISVFGAIIELSRFISTTHRVSRIARDSARVGSVILEGADPTGDVLTAAAESHAWLAFDASGLACSGGCVVNATWLEDDDSGFMVVRVDLTYPYVGLTGLMPGLGGAGVQSSFTMLTQQQAI